MDGDQSQPLPPSDSRQAPSVSSTVQMALYRPRGQPPDNQEEEEQLRSEDAPPPDDHLAEGAPTEATEPGSEEAEQQQDRRTDGALGRTDSTFSTAPRPRCRRRHHRRPVVARIDQRKIW